MFTRVDWMKADRKMGLCLAVWLFAAVIPGIGVSQTAKEPAGGLTPEQRQEIQAAQKPEDLLSLAKSYLAAKQQDAARACIVKSLQADPALLTDAKTPLPKSWSEFWFAERAIIREGKLKKDDAAGRVEIAAWLNKAGLGKEAREMLKAALEIDKSLPEARQLAQAWNLFGGGPFRFDLRYALTNPLLIDSLKDENEPLDARSGQKFMILPFAYEPADAKLRISKNAIKVKSDDGKQCRVIGIVLLTSPTTDQGQGSQADPFARAGQLSLQPEQEPVWEQMEVERKEDGTVELTCFNTTRPSSKRGGRPEMKASPRKSPSSPRPAPGHGRPGGAGLALPLSDFDMSVRGGDVGLQYSGLKGKMVRKAGGPPTDRGENPEPPSTKRPVGPTPPTQQQPPSRNPDDRMKTMPASGYAAFVVEVPTAMKSFEAVYNNEISIKVETAWLEMLEEPVGQQAPGEPALPRAKSPGPGGPADKQPTDPRTQQVDTLINMARARNPLFASAAVGKLAWIRDSAEQRKGQSPRPNEPPDRPDPTDQKIEQTLLEAMGHGEEQVRHEAFAALFYTDVSPNEAMLERACNQKVLALGMLEQVERALAVKAPAGDNPSMPSPRSSNDRYSQVVGPLIASLPVSLAPSNVFAALSACLSSTQAEVYPRALDIVFSDGSQQSVARLVDSPPGIRGAIVDRLTKVSDPTLKAALLRILLIRPDEATLARLLAACDDLTVVITGEDDPLLRAFMRRLTPEAEVKLVELLSRADLWAVTGSNGFKDVMDRIARDAQKTPAMQSALLKLALGQFQTPYQAPIPSGAGQGPRRGGGDMGAVSPFELVLAKVATTPNAEATIVQKAATALLRAGRIQALAEQMKTAPEQQQKLVNMLVQNKELWKHEALPILLASQLTDRDPKGAQVALNALADIYKGAEANERWRLNLAVKLGASTEELVKLTLAKDGKLAGAAMSLLAQLAQMSPAESAKVQSAAEAGERQELVKALDKERAEKPAGKLACVVYLDVKPVGGAEPGRGRAGAPPGERRPGAEDQRGPAVALTELTGIPMTSLEVEIRKEKQGGYRLLADGQDLGMGSDTGERRENAPSEAAVLIDAGPLLKEALKLADPKDQPFINQVNRDLLENQLQCHLRHLQLGTWAGEVRVDQRGSAFDQGSPLQITGAQVFLEPKTPRP